MRWVTDNIWNTYEWVLVQEYKRLAGAHCFNISVQKRNSFGIILNLVLNPTSEYYIATASWRYKENQ